MRCDQIVSRHLLKIPKGLPDKNGVIYSKKSIVESLYTIINAPFGCWVDGNFKLLGVVTDYAYVDESDDFMTVEIETKSFYGGTNENVNIGTDGICDVSGFCGFGFSVD